jgi:hypothetical protein
MDHATCSRLLTATHFATSLLPLTARLLPVITELGRLIVPFRRADPTPRDCQRFETRLQELLRELGRIVVEWTFNHLEPHDRKDLPAQIESHGTWYRRRSKTPNRSVATTFGTITLWRMLYQDVHGVEPSLFPLEIRLGLEAGRATPALAERAARAAVASPQGAVLAASRDDHGVRWSAATLRAVIAEVAAGNPDSVQSSPSSFLSLICSSINSATTSFLRWSLSRSAAMVRWRWPSGVPFFRSKAAVPFSKNCFC